MQQEHPSQHQNNQSNSKNNEEKKRSDENVSAPTQQQIQSAKTAIQQSKIAQLYVKQANGTATQTDVNIAYAPVTMQEITAFLAAQQNVPPPNQTTNQQLQQQWTQQKQPNLNNNNNSKGNLTYNNPQNQNVFFQQLHQMLGGTTMPPSQINNALPQDPTGMIATPVNPNLVPQLRAPPTGTFTNITPQQRQQILQIL